MSFFTRKQPSPPQTADEKLVEEFKVLMTMVAEAGVELRQRGIHVTVATSAGVGVRPENLRFVSATRTTEESF